MQYVEAETTFLTLFQYFAKSENPSDYTLIARKQMLSEEELYVLLKLGVCVCILKRTDEHFEGSQFFWAHHPVWENGSLEIVNLIPIYLTQKTCDRFAEAHDKIFRRDAPAT